MEAVTFVAGAAIGTAAFALRQSAKGKKYTCHADGSTDCPCYISEKSRPPVTPKLASVKVSLKPGEAAWVCTCGQSKNYPFCDGSHRAYNAANGTTFSPRKVETVVPEGEDVYLCACGHSPKFPFCTGTHKNVKLAK